MVLLGMKLENDPRLCFLDLQRCWWAGAPDLGSVFRCSPWAQFRPNIFGPSFLKGLTDPAILFPFLEYRLGGLVLSSFQVTAVQIEFHCLSVFTGGMLDNFSQTRKSSTMDRFYCPLSYEEIYYVTFNWMNPCFREIHRFTFD